MSYNFERLVFVESPHKGKNWEKTEENKKYALDCMKDCFINYNEAPFASHIAYIHEGLLDDKNPEERKMGMEAGWAYARYTEASVFYIDFGMSEGMKAGLENAMENKRRIEFRSLFNKDFINSELFY